MSNLPISTVPVDGLDIYMQNDDRIRVAHIYGTCIWRVQHHCCWIVTIYESCISKLFALKMIDGLAAMHTIRGPNSRRLEPLTSWLRTGDAYMMVDCVIIGPGDWFGINPLPEHVLTYCQLKTQEQTLARELLNGKVFNKQSSCRRFGTP